MFLYHTSDIPSDLSLYINDKNSAQYLAVEKPQNGYKYKFVTKMNLIRFTNKSKSSSIPNYLKSSYFNEVKS